MQSPKQNLNIVEKLRKDVLDHPLCADLQIDKRHAIMIFPNQISGVGGIRVSMANGKAKAFEQLLNKAELYWREEMRWWL